MSTNDLFDQLLVRIKKDIKDKDEIEIIKKAYRYALSKYAGEIRLSGDASINHCLNIVNILVDVLDDYKAISAAFMHELISGYGITKQEITEVFDEEIANLVDGITRISNIHFSTDNEYLIENYKKIIVGMSSDVRIIVVKLADRLDNMRTLWVFDEEIQMRKAKETLEILVPIASRLGMQRLKRELEDLSFRYLKPEVYFDIVEKIADMRIDLDKTLNEFILEVSENLKDHGIKHEIKGRAKSFYGIYTKLSKGRKFSDIYDILAIRIYVEKQEDCYQVLGLVHAKYKHIPKRFKDFIAMPKMNMYQSLHTTVFGTDGSTFEVQIRTYEMDKIAEYGLAAHWSYKEQVNQNEALKNFSDQRLQVFRHIMELKEEELSTEEFANTIRENAFNSNIYVYTPSGDVIEMPANATPIDFAYKVHSGVGNLMVGAMVNDEIVPLNHILQNGDVIKINTSNNSTGPKIEWLKIAKTMRAKTKIKNFFNKQSREDNIIKGKDILNKHCRKTKVGICTLLSKKNLNIILEELKLSDLEDLYYMIATNKITCESIIKIIFPEEETMEIKKDILKRESYEKTDIIIDGIDTIKVNIAKCCKPIPGDRIVGFISKNSGIALHRLICHNVSETAERLVNANWNKKIVNQYSTDIIVQCKKQDSVLSEILNRATLSKTVIENVVTIKKDNANVLKITVTLNNKDHLLRFLNDVTSIADVYAANRLVQ